MPLSIYTIRVQGADGRIVPASFRASSREAAESMALARGFDVFVPAEAAADLPATPSAPPLGALDGGALFLDAGPGPGPAPARLGASAAEPDGTIDRRSVARWAFWGWLLPLIAVVVGYLLGRMLPLDVWPRLATAGAVVVVMIIGVVVAVRALVAGSRRRRTGAIIHGALGLVVGLPLLLVVGGGVLLPGVTLLRMAIDAGRIAAREATDLPYPSGSGTVVACATVGNALLREVDIAGEAPGGAALQEAAAAHRVAVLDRLADQRGPLVDLLRRRNLPMVDRLRWAAGGSTIDVRITPRDWGERTPR